MDRERGATVDRAEALRRIGHSLRTPLSAINGASRVLAGTELTEDQREQLETIGTASDALLTAVNDLLDISEIEYGGLDLQHIPFRLPDAIREAVRPVRPLAADRGIEVTLHGLSALPTDVVGDPGRLRQVITRLVDNGVKFTHHGRVQVGAGLVAHDASTVTVRFAVRDAGIGIAEADLPRIFEPFSQAGEGNPAVSAGLGLTISRAAVQAMGGDILVDTKPGQGSTFAFTLTFPRHLEPEAADGAESQANRWVIVVGDRPESNQALADALRNGGFDPSEFSELAVASASVALSDDPAARPAAVVAAPTSHPFDVAQRIKLDRQLSEVPLVLVPPQGERGDGEECIRLGVEGYLPHPVSAVDLIEAVRILGRSERHMQLITRHWLRERRRQFKVLVVDDSPTGRALVMRALEGLGHEVEAASTGREAVDAVAESAFDVVLMDMEMPEMDGIEATKIIRRTEATIPIVGLSAHAFTADRRACLAAGMNEHITKPFKVENLQLVMEALVGRP